MLSMALEELMTLPRHLPPVPRPAVGPNEQYTYTDVQAIFVCCLVAPERICKRGGAQSGSKHIKKLSYPSLPSFWLRRYN